jgi:hypothetical protein
METEMKTLILTITLTTLALSVATPIQAAFVADGVYSLDKLADSSIEKRSKPRVKGGSGCDGAKDATEHPECN